MGNKVAPHLDFKGRPIEQGGAIRSSSARAAVASGGTNSLVAAPATGKVIRLLSVSAANTTAATNGTVEFRDGAAGTALLILASTGGSTQERIFAGKVALTSATLLQVAAVSAAHDIHVEYVIEDVSDGD